MKKIVWLVGLGALAWFFFKRKNGGIVKEEVGLTPGERRTNTTVTPPPVFRPKISVIKPATLKQGNVDL